MMLLNSARALCGTQVDLVAIDMPMSATPITGRRASDNAVSRAYGGRKCSTHSPSTVRPGLLSGVLRQQFDGAGFPLQTTGVSPPGLIEVYPHPALLELAKAPERLPYKAAKIRAYWPLLSPFERRVRLYHEWRKVITLLEGQISGVASAFAGLDAELSSARTKATEDALDAVVYAWVGICALEGRAVPFGDDESAIWIPISR